MIQFHEFYGKPTTQQINSFIKGMSHLISVKDTAEYIRKHFNLKKVKLNSTGTNQRSTEVQREGFQTIHNRRERDEGW